MTYFAALSWPQFPFFDQKKVVALLDSLHTMDEGTQVANNQVLMILVSARVLQQRFGLDPPGNAVVYPG